jgi:flagellar biosynthesis/type III secretory pathway chaperone
MRPLCSPRFTRSRSRRVANAKRVEREQLVSEFAAEHGCLPNSTLRQLMPEFPAEIRPMMEAMIDEINRLVHRARRGARQNTLLLQRAIAMHQEALRSLRPDSYSQTYSPRGQVSVGAPQAAAAASLQAVG